MTHAQEYQPEIEQQPRPQDGNWAGWLGLSLAICGLLLFWIPMVYPAAGIAGIVLGAVGYSKVRTGTATNAKAAISGVAIGVLAVVLPVVVLLGFAFYAASGG